MDSLNNTTPTTGNLFPIHAFPEEIQEIIHQLNNRLQFPVDYLGASILYAASVAIGITHKVQVKNGWLETAVVYIALVGRPGANKSAPPKFALAPLRKRDAATYQNYKQELTEFRKISSLNKNEREAQSMSGDPEKPKLVKHIVQDYTPEALNKILESNLRGIGVYNDELAGWFKTFGRYSKGNEQESVLSNWDGDSIIIDRKGDDPIFIKSPFMSVCGTIQPGILTDLAKGNRDQNGFIDRFLFAMPENSKKPYPNDLELDSNTSEYWDQYLSSLILMPLDTDENGDPKSHILKFTSKAKGLLNRWIEHNTDLINEAETDSIAGIYTKLERYIIRLSLILEMLSYTTGNSYKTHIQAATVERAILLIEYFRKTGLKVHAELNSTPFDRLNAIQKRVYDSLPDTFHTNVGVNIADREGMPEPTFKRLLQRSDLFIKERHGQYSKKF